MDFFAVLHDYDVKPPNFMFFGGREHMAIWSEILAGNNFIVCDLEEVRESMRSWEKIHSSIMSMKSERACKIKSSINKVYVMLCKASGPLDLVLIPTVLCLNVTFLFRIRVICYKIATNKYFVNFVLILIIVSSILLAAEDPLNASAKRNQVERL